jgi:hypothetical protein
MPPPDDAFLSMHRDAIEDKILAATAWPIYPYPWDTLEADLRKERRPLTLVAYGSLINAESWKDRPELGERGGPMLAFGVRRVFDYEMDEAACKRYGAPLSPGNRAALNAYVEGLPEVRMYGVGFNYGPVEIAKLRAREIAYDLIPVACARLDEQGEISAEVSLPLVLAYVLACPARPWKNRFYTHPHIRPHHGYYQVCAAGCSKISPAFLEAWKETSFLADRVTTVSRWEMARAVEQAGAPPS